MTGTTRAPRAGTLLRRRVENDWRITKPRIASKFYTARATVQLIEEIFFGLLDPAWHERFRFSLSEDAKGYGVNQTLALFGTPGETPLQIVFTCRHLTLRYNTDEQEPCAFGGPIFYAHEGPGKNALDPATNIFWPQAEAATAVYDSLSAEQRRQALETGAALGDAQIDYRDAATASTGIALGTLSAEQRALAERLLDSLTAPFRAEDRQRVHDCLAAQGGLEACRLTFYEQGQQLEGVWRCWRLQGPAFIWHFKGSPHIHVWVHVSRDPAVLANAADSYDLLEWRFGRPGRAARESNAAAAGS